MSRTGLTMVTLVALLGSIAPATLVSTQAVAATAHEITVEAEPALTQLYNLDPVARQLGRSAKGILVFPKITKAGIGIGGSYGEGVLYVSGKPVRYYSVSSGSLGVTLGAQAYSQVIMFMTDEALQAFQASNGWEAGINGTVVGVDVGAGDASSTLNAGAPIVGFIFGQKGLMVDASFGGMKYTPIKR